MKREILFGPPGTGKTTSLLTRLSAVLNDDVDPLRIAFLTFTKRAQQEAMQRVSMKLGYEPKELPHFRTIHSMAFKALELKQSDMVSAQSLDLLGAALGMHFTTSTDVLSEGLEGKENGGELLSLHNIARLRGITFKQAWERVNSQVPWPVADQFARSYESMKHEQGLLDFTDLLLEFVRRQIRLPVDVAFIDEAQDLSALQWLASLQAVEEAQVQYIAGDDDQCIFKWAGAEAELFIELEGDRTILNQSYRLPTLVHSLAQKVLGRIRSRVQKEFRARDAEGRIERAASLEHLKVREGEKWLWLVRNRYLIGGLLDYLRESNIVYSSHGRSSILEDEREALYDWERLRNGKAIVGRAVKNLYGFLKGNTQIEHGHKALKDIDLEAQYDLEALRKSFGLRVSGGVWFDVLTHIPTARRIYYRALLRNHSTLKLAPQVEVDTIHGAKGAEADNVALFLERSRRIYLESNTNTASADDEHRVWYVGVTRARERLVIVQSSNPWGYSL